MRVSNWGSLTMEEAATMARPRAFEAARERQSWVSGGAEVEVRLRSRSREAWQSGPRREIREE